MHHINDTIARLFRLKGPVLNSPPKNWSEWAALIDAGSAANRKPVAPVLVCEDTFDGGTVVPVPWQTAYVNAVKAFGGSVEVRQYPRPTTSHCQRPASVTPARGSTDSSKGVLGSLATTGYAVAPRRNRPRTARTPKDPEAHRSVHRGPPGPRSGPRKRSMNWASDQRWPSARASSNAL